MDECLISHFQEIFYCSCSSFGPLIRYKFDDERVTKEDIKRALEEQYGGEEEVIGGSIAWSHILLLLP